MRFVMSAFVVVAGLGLSSAGHAQKTGGPGGSGGSVIHNHYYYDGTRPTINTPAGNGGGGGNVGGGSPKDVTGSTPTKTSDLPTTRTLSKCLLNIEGKMVAQATGCNYVRSSETEFRMKAPSDDNTYVWRVVHDKDKTAGQGYLTSSKSPAERKLGRMTPQGACWVNTDGTVRVCGWN